ncbi:hypothetical protein DYH09_29530 [bacterium CPR1]|nr:hypothetical protein [bacterium CPR1]
MIENELVDLNLDQIEQLARQAFRRGEGSPVVMVVDPCDEEGLEMIDSLDLRDVKLEEGVLSTTLAVTSLEVASELVGRELAQPPAPGMFLVLSIPAVDQGQHWLRLGASQRQLLAESA